VIFGVVLIPVNGPMVDRAAQAENLSCNGYWPQRSGKPCVIGLARRLEMREGANSKTHGHERAVMAKRHSTGVRGPRMRDVPNIDIDEALEPGRDAPFAEGAIDALGAEFCHRIVRDLAEGGHVEGAEGDGSDPDDWLQAEADGAHLLPSPGR
jgi:hypothetical protein